MVRPVAAEADRHRRDGQLEAGIQVIPEPYEVTGLAVRTAQASTDEKAGLGGRRDRHGTERQQEDDNGAKLHGSTMRRRRTEGRSFLRPALRGNVRTIAPIQRPLVIRSRPSMCVRTTPVERSASAV